MPPDLSVTLPHEIALPVVLKDAATVLQTILKMSAAPKFTLTIPPGVKREVPDPQGQMLGLDFSSIYVGLDDPEEIYVRRDDGHVLADIGVIESERPTGNIPLMYFSGGRTRISKAVIAAFAIAVAELVGSEIEDSSGNWMPRETFTANDLLRAMTGPSAFNDCR